MAQKKILVIDGMPSAAAMVKARLEASGYKVVTASDGQQGLTLAHAEKPDLILLDIVMPAGEGDSVFTRLKTSPKTRSVPVIFLTAKDGPEDVARAYKLGVQSYLKKPYKPERLLETVKKTLEPPEYPPQSRGSRKGILIIGKEPGMVETVKLREVGYEVTAVSSIKEGAGEAASQRPDVILVDGMLIKADHYDGFYQFKLEFALNRIPVILLATQGEAEEFQSRLDGFARYCLKPLHTFDLLGLIRMALQKNERL